MLTNPTFKMVSSAPFSVLEASISSCEWISWSSIRTWSPSPPEQPAALSKPFLLSPFLGEFQLGGLTHPRIPSSVFAEAYRFLREEFVWKEEANNKRVWWEGISLRSKMRHIGTLFINTDSPCLGNFGSVYWFASIYNFNCVSKNRLRNHQGWIFAQRHHSTKVCISEASDTMRNPSSGPEWTTSSMIVLLSGGNFSDVHN